MLRYRFREKVFKNDINRKVKISFSGKIFKNDISRKVKI